MSTMIEVSGLTKTFNKTIHAVRGVDLSVEKGEVVVIVGPSGSGKSTVLRCMNLLEIPTGGDVWIDGATAAPEDDVARQDAIRVAGLE